jgi:hypothetical protein
LSEKWYRLDATTGRSVEVVMSPRREGKSEKMLQAGRAAERQRIIEMLERAAETQRWRGNMPGSVSLAAFAARLREER